jgi:hypothetical protein
LGSQAGDDTYSLGDGVSPLTINKSVNLFAGNGSGGKAELFNGATVQGNLSIYYAANVLLDPQSRVNDNVLIRGASGGAAAALNGTVAHDVAFIGFDQGNSVSTGTTSVIGGNLGIVTGAGSDSVNVSGLMKTLNIDTGGGNDQLTMSGTVQSSANILMGAGDDFATITGTVGTASSQGSLYLDVGTGNNSVSVANTAEVNGFGVVLFGAGANTFNLQPRNDVLSVLVVGGSGTNTFIGNKSQLRFPPVNF